MIKYFAWIKDLKKLLNPSCSMHFRELNEKKTELKFLFSQFFVVSQKVLWRFLRHS